MPHINEKVSNYDKVLIYVQTAKKICRGVIRSALFKRKKLPIFIGKHVDITHKEKIF